MDDQNNNLTNDITSLAQPQSVPEKNTESTETGFTLAQEPLETLQKTKDSAVPKEMVNENLLPQNPDVLTKEQDVSNSELNIQPTEQNIGSIKSDTQLESSPQKPESFLNSNAGISAKTGEHVAELEKEITPNLVGNDLPETKEAKKTNTLMWIVIGLIIIIVIIAGIVTFFQNQNSQTTITSFEECIASKGSMVQETYPPVCKTKDGLSFVANVPPVEEPAKSAVEIPKQPVEEKTKAELCYEQASNTECPEGTVCMANPASVFCECMGGVVEIRDDSENVEKGQVGVCIIDGGEFDEWEYFREMSPNEDLGVTEEVEDIIESPFENIQNLDYTLEKSEGSCTADSQCVWANQGCGRGHGFCTNEPEKYADMVTTCEVNPNFPANLGYSCGCVETQGVCGWEK